MAFDCDPPERPDGPSDHTHTSVFLRAAAVCLKMFPTAGDNTPVGIEPRSKEKKAEVWERHGDGGERKKKKTQRGLPAKLSHCDSKSSFNKVHAVYNFIIFSWMIITLFNHVQGFSES